MLLHGQIDLTLKVNHASDSIFSASLTASDLSLLPTPITTPPTPIYQPA